MKAITCCAALSVLVSGASFAELLSGNSALTLGALVVQYSPSSTAIDKSVLEKFLNGLTNVRYPSNKKISVVADLVACRASNVDITHHSCDLTFGTKKIALTGRKALELYTTLAALGVPASGGAGSMFETISNLNCTIDPGEVRNKDSGGANCSFKTEGS